jgi:hypothetical protein
LTAGTGASFLECVLETYGKAFHEERKHPKKKLTTQDLLTMSIPALLEADGSKDSFAELVENLADPTSLVNFDPDIFKAALTGVLQNNLPGL